MKYLFTCLAFALFACHQNSKDTRHDAFNTKMDQYFSKALPADQPGGAVLVMKGDKVVFAKGFGLADMQTKDSITTKTLFNLGSISKTFVAHGILLLRDEGKLSLDDPLSKYFTFKNKAIGDSVRIKHLLTHTSGLSDTRQTRTDSVFYLTAKDAENWAPILQTDSLHFRPGSQYEYSNPAFNALALIIEQVSGQRWQSFVEERIFKPAGMTTSTITDGPHPETGVSHSYLSINGSWIEKDYGEEPTFAAAGNGGVWSSVEELASYELALRNAKFSKAETIAESRTIKDFGVWDMPKPPFIGWSWFIASIDNNVVTVGHTGSQGGFLCNYVSIPEKEVLFVILCNTPTDMQDITKRVVMWMKEDNWLDSPQ